MDKGMEWIIEVGGCVQTPGYKLRRTWEDGGWQDDDKSSAPVDDGMSEDDARKLRPLEVLYCRRCDLAWAAYNNQDLYLGLACWRILLGIPIQCGFANQDEGDGWWAEMTRLQEQAEAESIVEWEAARAAAIAAGAAWRDEWRGPDPTTLDTRHNTLNRAADTLLAESGLDGTFRHWVTQWLLSDCESLFDLDTILFNADPIITFRIEGRAPTACLVLPEGMPDELARALCRHVQRLYKKKRDQNITVIPEDLGAPDSAVHFYERLSAATAEAKVGGSSPGRWQGSAAAKHLRDRLRTRKEQLPPNCGWSSLIDTPEGQEYLTWKGLTEAARRTKKTALFNALKPRSNIGAAQGSSGASA